MPRRFGLIAKKLEFDAADVSFAHVDSQVSQCLNDLRRGSGGLGRCSAWRLCSRLSHGRSLFVDEFDVVRNVVGDVCQHCFKRQRTCVGMIYCALELVGL